MHVASQHGHADVVRLLVAHGADVNIKKEVRCSCESRRLCTFRLFHILCGLHALVFALHRC